MGKCANAEILLTDAPAITGLTFRGFCGEVDYAAMVDVINGSKETDGLEETTSVEDLARSYKHLVNCDPYQDMLFAEVDGEVVGYGRVWWQQYLAGERVYLHLAYLRPEWRTQGIRRAMLRHNERRLREIAADHQDVDERVFQAWAYDTESDWKASLVSAGYEAVRYGFNMVRPNLDDIPDLPLPKGLEVRPARPEHYQVIWDAAEEAFEDNWGEARDGSDAEFAEWQASPTFMPDLWQVAWDGQQVAGMVLNFINHQENKEYDRQRGYTENISVRRPWRRRGLARALIARSLRVVKEQGMTEAALGVDAENANRALRLYQSMGFREIKRFVLFRKPLN